MVFLQIINVIFYFIYKRDVIVDFKSHFVYPAGKPMAPHLLRCQWIGVGDYTLNIGRLEAGAPSTFAQLGLNIIIPALEMMKYLSDQMTL